MLRLAWLPIAQHVFQPALTGRLELISRKIVSSEQEQRLSRWADFAKNCLPRIECKELPRFREKYRALGRHVCKIREIGGQKLGSNMRPRYIQFRDISGLHCICYFKLNSNWNYSPETPNLHQICRFLALCDLEIWRMTLKNNRAPLLCHFKLCAAFRTHWWTGVTVRKRPIWVKFDDF